MFTFCRAKGPLSGLLAYAKHYFKIWATGLLAGLTLESVQHRDGFL